MSLALADVHQRLKPLRIDRTLGSLVSGLALGDPKWIPQRHELPAAAVLAGGERGKPSPGGSGRHRQKIDELLRIVLVVQSKTGRYEAADDAAFDVLKAAVRGLIVGWQPPPDGDPFDFVSGKIVTLKNHLLFWEEVYRTSFQYRPQG